jgi:hypothetical protein
MRVILRRDGTPSELDAWAEDTVKLLSTAVEDCPARPRAKDDDLTVAAVRASSKRPEGLNEKNKDANE